MSFIRFLLFFSYSSYLLAQINGHPGGGGPDHRKNDKGMQCEIKMTMIQDYESDFYKSWHPNEKEVKTTEFHSLLKDIIKDEIAHNLKFGPIQKHECESDSSLHVQNRSSREKELKLLEDLKILIKQNNGKSYCPEVMKKTISYKEDLEVVIKIYEKK